MNFKKLTAILMALVMIFALSATAFATGNTNTVTLKIVINGTLVDTLYDAVAPGETVYNVVNRQLGERAGWSNQYLQSIIVDGETYGSAPYIPEEGAFDEYGEYVEGMDREIERLNSKPEYVACDGVYMDASDIFAPGYYFMGDMQHMCYIGYDWTYEVDYAADGIGNPVVPGEERIGWYDDFYQYTMDECVVTNGDIINLNYSITDVVF